MQIQRFLFIVAIALYSIFFPSQTFADTENSVSTNESVFEKVGDIGEKRASELGITTPFKEKVKINGQTVLFTESLYDGSSIHLAFLIKPDNKNNANLSNGFWDDIIFTRNGKRLMLDGMGARGKSLDNGDYAGTATIKLHEGVPDSFMLGITSSHTDRSWYVEVPIKLKGERTTFPVNETKRWRALDLTYDKITFFPTSTEISFRYMIDEERIRNTSIGLNVYDNQGRILQPLSGGGGGRPAKNGQVLVTSSYYFEPLDNLPKSVTVKPYLLRTGSYKPETVRKKWEGKGFTLSQGDIGALNVINVENKDGLLTITYQIEGDRDYSQATAVWVEDTDGKRYPNTHPPKRLEGGKNKYKMTFSSVDHLDDIYIGTSHLRSIKYIDELEHTIKLTNYGESAKN